MKTVAVFFNAPNYGDYPFDNQYYIDSYHELAGLLRDRGATLSIVRGQQTYLGNNVFSHGWTFDGTTFVHTDGKIVADLIYDKGNFVHDAGAVLLNDGEMNDICTDKSKTYALFPDLCPRTVTVRDAEELERELPAFGERVVAKPLDDEGGKGVIIDTPDVVRRSVRTYPYLLQEFLDTSDGIPGVIKEMHDLRMICVNGEAILCYIRSPAPGKMLSNVAQGGKQTELPAKDIPAEALELFRAVDAVFAKYGRRVYSVDCARNKDGAWKIIELNSKPGLSKASDGPEHIVFQNRLADALVS